LLSNYSLELWGKTGDKYIEDLKNDQPQSSSSDDNVNHVVPLPYNNRPRQILFPMTVLIVTHFTGLFIFFIIANNFSYNQLSEIFGIRVRNLDILKYLLFDVKYVKKYFICIFRNL
jgi:hypothetical protein